MEESVPLEEEKHDIRIFSLPIDSNNIGKNVDMENIFSNTEPPSPMTDASVPNFVSNHKPSEINRKPKYNLKNLKGILKKKLKNYGKIKYEDIDNELAILYTELWSNKQKDLDLSAIKYCHPYYRIDEDQIEDIEDKRARKDYGEKIIGDYCDEYDLVRKLLQFASKLTIKWKIGNLTNLLYRFSPKYGHTGLLDMESLTNDYFTIESIWLSIEAENLPEELGIDEETKSLAKFYYDSALSVIKFLLEIYQENRVLENQNEESHSRSYELCKATHNFKIPSILSRCFTYAYINPKNKKLKYLIEELDYACRNFEERIFEILHDYYLAIKLDNDD